MKRTRLNDRERAHIILADGEIIAQHSGASGSHWIVKAYGQIWLIEQDRKGKYTVTQRKDVGR